MKGNVSPFEVQSRVHANPNRAALRLLQLSEETLLKLSTVIEILPDRI